MCSDETMNQGLSSSVGNAEKQHLLRTSLHHAKYPRTFRYSPSLILSLGTKRWPTRWPTRWWDRILKFYHVDVVLFIVVFTSERFDDLLHFLKSLVL